MPLNKSPGKDLTIAFSFKKLHFYIDKLTEFYQNTYNGRENLPTLLTEAKTNLSQKASTLKLPKMIDQ